jgi:gliding motility-associated-like protein
MKAISMTGCFLVCAMLTVAQTFQSGFENYLSLPNGLGEWYRIRGVSNPSSDGQASPDYFHILGNASCDLPETPYAMLQPKEGQAIMGIEVSGTNEAIQREYLTIVLDQPLHAGKNYEFKISWSNGKLTPISNSGLAINGMGFLFTEQMPVQTSALPIVNEPQFTFSRPIFSETWVESKIQFRADVAAKYITIGLFGSNGGRALKTAAKSGQKVAYYFFDDARIDPLPDSLDFTEPKIFDGMINPIEAVGKDEVFVPNSFSPNEDGLNDVFLSNSYEIDGWNLTVFNRWGSQVFQSKSALEGWDGKFNGKSVEMGSYYWTLIYKNESGRRSERQGFVNVLR